MSATVLVTCPSCDGRREHEDGRFCGDCMSQGHIAVNRTPDGGIPDGFREWVPPLLESPTHASPE